MLSTLWYDVGLKTLKIDHPFEVFARVSGNFLKKGKLHNHSYYCKEQCDIFYNGLVFLSIFFHRNIIENMFMKLEKYSACLEATVQERTKLLEEERRKTDALLQRILPV